MATEKNKMPSITLPSPEQLHPNSSAHRIGLIIYMPTIPATDDCPSAHTKRRLFLFPFSILPGNIKSPSQWDMKSINHISLRINSHIMPITLWLWGMTCKRGKVIQEEMPHTIYSFTPSSAERVLWWRCFTHSQCNPKGWLGWHRPLVLALRCHKHPKSQSCRRRGLHQLSRAKSSSCANRMEVSLHFLGGTFWGWDIWEEGG